MSDPREESAKALKPSETHGMLPGVAAICLYLLVVAMLNTFAALRGYFGPGRAKLGVLALCTLVIVGVFGTLRMRRWGLAIVTAGSLLMGIGDLYFYIHTHIVYFLVRALFGIVFFLYLVRPEVRERMR